jgi:hypothetical protein
MKVGATGIGVCRLRRAKNLVQAAINVESDLTTHRWHASCLVSKTRAFDGTVLERDQVI